MIKEVFDIFPENIYLVGGCVRDIKMAKTPKDYDFATALEPDDIELHIKARGKKAYNIGKKFGTVGMKIDGQMVEITTFRSEEYHEGSRKPKVEYLTDIIQDLSRRDFTMNAMAMNREKKLIDPFGGKLDILEKTIKAVGIPKHRFKEDPLRMLRAARFVGQLGFTIENTTETSITRASMNILKVSRERWVLEMDKILLSEHVGEALDILAKTRLLNFMIPELSLQVGYDQNSPYHEFTLWEHTKNVVKGLPKDLDLRWAGLLHDIAKPFVRTDKKDRSNYLCHDILGAEIVEKVARYLKWSNDRREKVIDLVLHHLEDNSPLRDADNRAKYE